MALAVIDHHAHLHRSFRWRVPPQFNWAEACCGRWSRDAHNALSPAVIYEREDGRISTLSFGALQGQANRLSHALGRRGVRRGDRVAVVMSQRPETAVAHIAISQLGAVAVPLSMLFGPDAMEVRLRDSGGRLAIVDESGIDALRSAVLACPDLTEIIAVGAAAGRGSIDWDAALACEHAVFDARSTDADEPAVLIYTSGTTGPPKGALIPQRALIGNLPGFVCSQNWFPQADSVFWSPADWAWTGGLMDALLPTLYFGRPIVAAEGRFSPHKAFELLERHRVTHSFLFPTALKAMMKAVPRPAAFHALRLRAVMSAGEAVGDAVFAYGREQLGLAINEMFGQTEINYIVGNGGRWIDVDGQGHVGWPARPGSMGRAYPGHRIAVLDDDGREVPRGTPGDVALHRRDVHGELDPIFFLGYWQRDDATRAKFTGDPDDSWCRTGDTAQMDERGYLWYQGRSDDVFKAAGYRIGPSEIENCLVKHAAVANAAVVPKPDRERGALVKAYVVLASGVAPSVQLVEELQRHVRGRLAPYEYPKEIEFIDALPMTTTGKVQRRVLRLQEEERARVAVTPT